MSFQVPQNFCCLETDGSLIGKHVAHSEWRGKASISVKAPEGFGACCDYL